MANRSYPRRSTACVLPLLLGLGLLAGGCSHTYSLKLQGQAAPGARVQASYWAQPAGELVPEQRPGTSVVADSTTGAFTVESRTKLHSRWFSMPGPPPHLTLQVEGLAELPLCVVVPTKGLWEEQREQRVTLPPLRAPTADEAAYDLPAPGLPSALRVVRKDPAQAACVQPGN